MLASTFSQVVLKQLFSIVTDCHRNDWFDIKIKSITSLLMLELTYEKVVMSKIQNIHHDDLYVTLQILSTFYKFLQVYIIEYISCLEILENKGLHSYILCYIYMYIYIYILHKTLLLFYGTLVVVP